MMKNIKVKREKTLRRAHRVRVQIRGTEVKPRLSVKRSLRHVYVQVINDEKGYTLCAASDKEIETKGKKPVEIAKEIGQLIAKKAKEVGITTVIFDRGSYRYHGSVKAVAEGAREEGLIL
ncbi:MAG: 50S ribosomal protein L18 [Candidatus Uhrbacteria bacterium GW2011_GWE2_40_58]|nr:MAG: 50S ribosomal protein L18 [Candidatus Uhrbacteria bacterium GW2011_GWF2_40_263]KKR67524.1 MAG: 50S ribosomal protein L18 [Candidatus Uhrbacteria bacterium GW2011_GWE2_40_58]OGL93711.1 MAG: 50S ribosomal protein L18 [Candidatus Uhrbacteria bacterium RIFOXYA2_FULL_40_9]OGL96448.1 MAG: 50S ribosomal protein L18 [Candidatus Uhrbacteria bacterium RIFOXYB2_FULL_41_18]HBK34858.1 50S ribosomal protein L18 [Candidatus Uhrbacteria bacterium]